jgi:hypothetical protein
VVFVCMRMSRLMHGAPDDRPEGLHYDGSA